MIELTIIPPPPSLNKMLLMHHHTRTKLKRKLYDEIWFQICGLRPRVRSRGPVVLHATRYAIRRLDGFDNYRASLKWPIDVLVKLQVIKDDSDEYLTAGEITQVRVRHRKDERLVIRVEERARQK